MKTRLLPAAALAGSALLLPSGLAAAPPAGLAEHTPARQASGSPVTAEGFDRYMFDATLYVEVPMEGTFGLDVYEDAILQTVRMAAADPHIQHVVYVIDSDSDQGSLFDKEVVGTHQDELEVHAIVKDALYLAMFPVFFCDSIFVVDGSRIGGLPLERYVPQGSEEVTAKMLGIFSGQLESAAETHGHEPAIVRAMIGQDDSLHYWLERGLVHVANSAPPSTGLVDDYEHITPFYTGTTVTLDHEQAVKLELAELIEEYDAVWIGDKIGARNWGPANRFGHVAEQLAYIGSDLSDYQDLLDNLDKQLPAIQRTRENRNDREVEMILDAKRNLERGVNAIDTINESIESLYTSHPERHAYFAGPGNTTVLADPEQWESDVQTAQQLIGRLRSGLSTLRSTFQNLDRVQLLFPGLNLINPANLDEYIDKVNELSQELDGIRRHGNAHYWENIYVEPYPEDEYGVTYG